MKQTQMPILAGLLIFVVLLNVAGVFVLIVLKFAGITFKGESVRSVFLLIMFLGSLHYVRSRRNDGAANPSETADKIAVKSSDESVRDA